MMSAQDLLDGLAADRRFAVLANTHSTQVCSLALWTLDIHASTGRETRLLYGWVVASASPQPSAWIVANGPEWSADDEANRAKYRLKRLVLNERPGKLRPLIAALFDAASLGDASNAAGIPLPGDSIELRLAPTKELISRYYVTGPFRFLSKATASALPRWALPLSSPSSTAPGFSVCMSRLQKTLLWAEVAAPPPRDIYPEPEVAPLPGDDELGRRSLSYLAQETGLSFCGPDARRLGDIEWISTPAADLFENELVRVHPERDLSSGTPVVRGVTVEIDDVVGEKGTSLWVRCRLFHGNEIAFDELREFSVGAKQLRFPSSDELTRILVTIWAPDAEGSASIWYESDCVLIRQIDIGIGLSGLQGELRTGWTQGVRTRSNDVKARMRRVVALKQAHYENTMAGGWSPRERSDREMNEVTQRLFPAGSGARFFPKGWDKTEGPGMLGFIEWFQKITEDPRLGRMVIVDPYFDDVGVADVLARARATQAQYVAITSTTLKSKDDAASKQTREERIVSACKKLESIVGNLNLRILDVRSKTAREEPLFHDRYVLLYGPSEKPIRGFHLSNSIQQATRNFPLLITPIPDDVLPRVAEYLVDLREVSPEALPNAESVVLYDSSTRRRSAFQQRPAVVDGHLMSLLLSDPSLESDTEDSIRKKLLAAGHLTDESHFAPSTATRAGVERLAAALSVAGDEPFARLWQSVGQWRLHAAAEADVDVVLAGYAQSLSPKLAAFLKRIPDELKSSADNLDPSNLALGYLFFSGFEQVVTNAEHGSAFLDRAAASTTPAGWYAAKTLAAIDPASLVATADAIVHGIPDRILQDAMALEYAPHVTTLLLILGNLVERLYGSPSVVHAMLESKIPLLRAIAARAVTFRSGALEAGLTELRALPENDRLRTLAEVIGDHRVLANRAGKEQEDVRARRLKVIKELVEAWPNSTDTNLLRDVAHRAGGPIEGSWATSTTQDLFIPLIVSGKLSWSMVLDLWGSVLEENLIATAVKGHQEMKEAQSHAFFRPSDGELTRAFVRAYMFPPRASRDAWLERVLKPTRMSKRILGAPYAKSRSYQEWAGAADVVAWTWATLALLAAEGATSLSEDELEQLKKEAAELNALRKRSRAHNQELQGFVSEVEAGTSNA
jgi:hypothetical protein